MSGSPSVDPFGKSVARIGNVDPFSGVPKKKSSKPHHLTDFLTGSPAKSSLDPSSTKEKKRHKWVPKLSPSALKDKSKSSSSKANPEETQMKMAAEASRRAEDERMKRLQIQEEQDLAYAIALSKAEAASLKTS